MRSAVISIVAAHRWVSHHPTLPPPLLSFLAAGPGSVFYHIAPVNIVDSQLLIFIQDAQDSGKLH